MKQVVSTFARGLGVVLPIVITGWLVVWLASGAEALLRDVFVFFLPAHLYVPGLGVALGLLFVYASGVLVQVFLVEQVWGWVEGLLARIPLVKTIYSALREFFGFFSSDVAEGSSRVVSVEFGQGARLIGFVTADNPPLVSEPGADMVFVYLPMSYQLGGYTVLIPRARIQDLDIGVEDAMKLVLTAGIQRTAPASVKRRPRGRQGTG